IPTSGLSFDGGPNSVTGDKLILNRGTSGGLFNTITHTFTNDNDGSVALDTDGPGGASAFTINYTGLEPITDSLDAVSRVFTYGSDSETISLVDAPGSNMTIDSTSGESVTFSNQTSFLTINAGGGSDTVNITS